MTNLALEELGVEALDQRSSEEINGGYGPALVGAVAGIILLGMYEGGKALGRMLYKELH